MLDQTVNQPQSASEILGDLAALAEQLGHPDGLCTLAPSEARLASIQLRTAAGLRRFLEEYASQVLLAHELPAIADAYGHVTRYEVRELIALDQSLANVPAIQGFAAASRAVGKNQLLRLKPLRGERVVQRYVRAVEAGEANAWHPLVFGLLLALYSFPLRQGLVHFAHQTLRGYVHAAGPRLRLTSAQMTELLTTQANAVFGQLESILNRQVAKPS